MEILHTSGSTGKPKEIVVEKSRMLASARMTCDTLGLKPGDKALLCLSTDYIAGRMMEVRCEERRMQLTRTEPSGHPLRDIDETFDLVAMVPLQVANTLDVPTECERFKRIRNVLIGGGPIPASMALRLQNFPNALWATYGMTETLSHIALRRLSGPAASEWYTPMPGVQVRLNAESCLVIEAPAVCREVLVTNDIACLHPSDVQSGTPSPRFRILGRKDNVICSGGKKFQAEEIERQLEPHITKFFIHETETNEDCTHSNDSTLNFIITSCPDEKLGEAIVLLTTHPEPELLREICQRVLPRHACPRHYVHIDEIPTTRTGKPIHNKIPK